MVRVLIIIAVTAFLLCVVSLSAAVAIGGREVAKAGWTWNPWWADFDDEGSGVHIRSRHGPRATREIAWDGSERLVVDIPANVRFVQADGDAKLALSGPQALVDAIRLQNGHIRLAEGFHGRFGSAAITLTAPKVTQFELNGSNELVIQNYRQDRLEIQVNGRADVGAAGEAKALQLTVSGAGDADLADLVTDEATVSITGAGEAVIAPKTRARIDIAGSAEVTLLTKPAQLETNVTGSGKVIHADPDGMAAEPPAPPAAPKPVA